MTVVMRRSPHLGVLMSKDLPIAELTKTFVPRHAGPADTNVLVNSVGSPVRVAERTVCTQWTQWTDRGSASGTRGVRARRPGAPVLPATGAPRRVGDPPPSRDGHHQVRVVRGRSYDQDLCRYFIGTFGTVGSSKCADVRSWRRGAVVQQGGPGAPATARPDPGGARRQVGPQPAGDRQDRIWSDHPEAADGAAAGRCLRPDRRRARALQPVRRRGPGSGRTRCGAGPTAAGRVPFPGTGVAARVAGRGDHRRAVRG